MTQGAWSTWLARVSSWLLFAAAALGATAVRLDPAHRHCVSGASCSAACSGVGAGALACAGQLALAVSPAVVVAAYALVLARTTGGASLACSRSRIRFGRRLQAALGVPLSPRSRSPVASPGSSLAGRSSACWRSPAAFSSASTRTRPPAHEGHCLVGCGLRGLRHPGALVRPDPHPWLAKSMPIWTRSPATFINRNTAAAYFGSCAVVWSLLFWERVRLEMPRGPLEWRALPHRLFSATPKKVVACICDAVSVSCGHVHDRLARRGLGIAARAHRGFYCLLSARPAATDRARDALAGGGAVALILLQTHGGGRQRPVRLPRPRRRGAV